MALTLLNIGILSSRRGDYGKALQALTEAGQIYEALGVDRGARLVDLEMLPTCVALNLREESAAAAERAIEGLRRLAMPFELGQALLSAGRLADADGDAEVARGHTAEARAIFSEMGNRVWGDSATLQEARLLAKAAAEDPESVDEAELRQSLEGCRAATSALEQTGARDQAAFGLLVEGRCLARLGDVDAAHSCYQRACETASRLDADHLLFQGHEAIGDLLQESAPMDAVENYRRAIGHLETVRSRAVVSELKTAFLTDKSDVYERLVELLIREPTTETISEAYRYVERSKSRTLLEDLRAGQAGASRSRGSKVTRLVQRIRDLRAQLNTAYMTAYAGNGRPGDSLSRSGQGDSVANLEQALARATRELELAEVKERGHYGPVAHSNAAERPLPAGELLIEFYSVGDGSACVRAARRRDRTATGGSTSRILRRWPISSASRSASARSVPSM